MPGKLGMRRIRAEIIETKHDILWNLIYVLLRWQVIPHEAAWGFRSDLERYLYKFKHPNHFRIR